MDQHHLDTDKHENASKLNIKTKTTMLLIMEFMNLGDILSKLKLNIFLYIRNLKYCAFNTIL